MPETNVSTDNFVQNKAVDFSWTPERVRQLEELCAGGEFLFAREIAAEMGDGLTANAVIGKCWRNGIRLPLSPYPHKIVRPTPDPFPKDGCLWPNGHPGESGFHFCGEARAGGAAYCSEHAARAYRPVEGEPNEA